MSDEAAIGAMERQADGFRLPSPDGRMDNVKMSEQARREHVESLGLVRLPRLSFLDPDRLLAFEKAGRK